MIRISARVFPAVLEIVADHAGEDSDYSLPLFGRGGYELGISQRELQGGLPAAWD